MPQQSPEEDVAGHQAQAVQPSVAYLDRLLASLSSAERNLPRLTAAAEAAAQSLLEGHNIFIGGSYPGFAAEGLGRAGGLVNLKSLPAPEEVAAGDVVLLGVVDPADRRDRATLQALDEQQAIVVLFASEDMPGSSFFIDAFAPPANDPQALPVVSCSLAANLWAFTGELVAALTRRGKMPPMYQSMLVPGGDEHNRARVGKMRWEPRTPPAVPEYVLGRTYLARIANILRRLRAREGSKFAAAGALAAEALRNGHTVHAVFLGHMTPFEPQLVGDPGLFRVISHGLEPDVGALLQAHNGDVVLYIGYYEPYGPWVETAHGCGAKIVTVVSGTPQRGATQMGADINIEPGWPYGDALVEVAGYPIRILPPSGVIQAAAYWMLVAETLGSMAEGR